MRAVLKVGITGTHSTGKSTFAQALDDRLRAGGLKVARVGELAKRARDQGFPILTQHTCDSTLWIMAECMRREAEATLTCDVVIVDRPVLDAVGYLDAALEVSGRIEDSARLTTLREVARSYSNEYAFFVATRLDESIALGPGRDTDQNFRHAAARHIAALASCLDRLPDELTSSNLSEMVGKISEAILQGQSVLGPRR